MLQGDVLAGALNDCTQTLKRFPQECENKMDISYWMQTYVPDNPAIESYGYFAPAKDTRLSQTIS